MNVYSKGINSRERLITNSRIFFNEYGLSFTLNNLAKKLNVTLGMVTYHFPTKDHLFVAIAESYESKIAEARINPGTTAFNIAEIYKSMERLMDIQYDHRCVMHYIASAIRQQNVLFNHVTETFRQNRSRISSLIKALVDSEELKPTILEDENYRIILFCLTNLLTTWVINLQVYDYEKSYQIMKPVYLKGAFSVFQPYLTLKGSESLARIGVNFS